MVRTFRQPLRMGPDGKRTVNHLNQRRVLLEIYAGLLRRIWQRALPLVGAFAIQGLFQQALQEAGAEYGFLRTLPLAEGSVDAEAWMDRCPEVAVDDLRAGLAALIVHLFGRAPLRPGA